MPISSKAICPLAEFWVKMVITGKSGQIHLVWTPGTEFAVRKGETVYMRIAITTYAAKPTTYATPIAIYWGRMIE